MKSESGPAKAAQKQKKWYAVHSGRQPGVYTTWDECKDQVVGAKRPVYKAFASLEEAENFVQNGTADAPQTGEGGAAVNDEIAIGHQSGKRKIEEAKAKAPPAKKQKKSTGYTGLDNEELDETQHDPGTGPLPPGAEDGFDPRVILAPQALDNSYIQYKTPLQRDSAKMQAVGLDPSTVVDIYTDGCCKSNGVAGKATAGWGVYFGAPIGK